MSGWVTEQTDGLWIFRHPDGRRIEALANDRVTTPTVIRHRILAALNAADLDAAP